MTTQDLNNMHDAVSTFISKRAGRVLSIRKAYLVNDRTQVARVPVFTNVSRGYYVGDIHIKADTLEILNSELDVASMVERGHQSLGFQSLSEDKQEKLSELLWVNKERDLNDAEQKELDELVSEQQDIQIQNLEQLEHKLSS